MSELVIRGHHNDHLVVAELLSGAALPIAARRLIRRIVVDAPAAAATGQFARAAVDGGTQYLIDPMTPLLLDHQAATDSWARLPYATARPASMSELANSQWREALVRGVVDFQVEHGATAIIPPYLHLVQADSALAHAQVALWRATVKYLRQQGLDYSLVPIVSVDRHRIALEMNAWEAGLGRLLRVAGGMTDDPVGLALSASSNLTGHSIHKMSLIWRRAASLTMFIAWHAGDVGPLAVTLGAAGYEVGLCSSERCNVTQELRNRRLSDNRGGPRWLGVYVDALGRSIGKSAVTAMSRERGLQGDVGCFEPACCRRGFDSLLGSNRRQHAARSRLLALADLDAITARRWRLHTLERRAAAGAAAATRIRKFADARGIAVGAYPAEFQAMQAALQGLRSTARTAVA